MTAYYNEIDPFAAQWLRNLIAEGLIAPGEVDERSIKDVQADDLRGFQQCHFFAGVGGWSYALRLAGWPDGFPVWTGSCPCQSLSVAGKLKGASDERHLWPAFFSLIAECRPATIFGEQVASPLGREWLAGIRCDMEASRYALGAADLSVAGVGAPHIRQRLYWVAHADGERRAAWNDEAARMGHWRPAFAERNRGFWDDFEAHEGDDGTLRRTGPGIFALAHGVRGRVGALRGAGNAISPELAAEFIAAAGEALMLSPKH